MKFLGRPWEPHLNRSAKSIRDGLGPFTTFEEAKQHTEELAGFATQMWDEAGQRVFSFEHGMLEDFLKTGIPSKEILDKIHGPFPVSIYRFESAEDPTIEDCGLMVINGYTEGDVTGVMTMFWSTEHECWHYVFWATEIDQVRFFLPVEDPRQHEFARRAAAEMFVVGLQATLYLSDPRTPLAESPKLSEEINLLKRRIRKSKSVKLKDRLKTQLSELERRSPIVIVRRPPQPQLPVVDPGSGKKLDHRIEVRGHWRWQACGRNRSQRKRIWVEAHQKGPENAPIVPRSYRVDKERT